MRLRFLGHTTTDPLTHTFYRYIPEDATEFIDHYIQDWYDIHKVEVNDVPIANDRGVENKPELIRRIKAMAMLTNKRYMLAARH